MQLLLASLFVVMTQAGLATGELPSAAAILRSKDMILKHKPCCLCAQVGVIAL